ncbi:MAG: hypothetical protein JEY99_19055 [Spirochaetales bacterium]|nr:hypothetical protein [Spirochaetales bacterium]
MKNIELTIESIKKITENRQPQFGNIESILARGKADRTVLFELFMNYSLYTDVNGHGPKDSSFKEKILWTMQAFRRLGYDYFSLDAPSDFFFPRCEHNEGDSISQNDMTMIRNRSDFNSYPWPRIEMIDFSYLDLLNHEMIPGMKAIPFSPGGVLENTTEILGFDNMCYLLYDDPELLEDVFTRVGGILLEYYKTILDYDCIGAVIVNDDWGFATQTMLSTEMMRKYVVPWHKRIAEITHKAGKKTIMHSCGQLELIMDDVIDDIKHDGKHSYEDKILPVEEAYLCWNDRIAIFGGIDIDFICRSTPEEVYNRSKSMCELTGNKGYALGTGNSVPEYIPRKNYLAMLLAGLEE